MYVSTYIILQCNNILAKYEKNLNEKFSYK